MTHSAVYSVGDFLYGHSNRTYLKRQLKTTFTAQAKFFEDKLRVNADFTYRNHDFNTTVKKVKANSPDMKDRWRPFPEHNPT